MTKHHSVPRHVLGGIALTNGVLLHAPDAAVLGIRDASGEILMQAWDIHDIKEPYSWLAWPGIRGLWLLSRTMLWNSRIRALADSIVKDITASIGKDKSSHPARSMSPTSLFPSLSLLAAFLVYALVILGINTGYQLSSGQTDMALSTGLTFAFTVLFLIALVRRAGIWSYMGYHGALHQAVHAYENGDHTVKAVQDAWAYQMRCGASVVSFVALFLVIIGVIWTNVAWWWSVPLAIILFSLSYEIVLFLDRHSAFKWTHIAWLPGVALQFLIARHPDAQQSEVAAEVLNKLIHHSKALKVHVVQAEMPLT